MVQINFGGKIYTPELGLTKSYDLKIRYFSEKGQEVRDVFINSHPLGHETADIQVAKCLESLEEDVLDIKKVLALSRDNPNVMKSFANKFNEVALDEGNPNIYQAPDYLHPAHQALREAMVKLAVDMDDFFTDVFKFFQHTTARREDVLEIRINLVNGEDDLFFKRHVNSRWLSTVPVAKRILQHWESLREYIVNFLPKDKSQASKNTIETERFKRMFNILRNSNYRKNKARIELIIFLGDLNLIFMKTILSGPWSTGFLSTVLLLSSLIWTLFFRITPFLKVPQTLKTLTSVIPPFTSLSNAQTLAKLSTSP